MSLTASRLGAALLMGAWLMGTVFMWMVAAGNFRTVDRLLAASANASFREIAQGLGEEKTREVLRYLSSELNRRYFQIWNMLQVAIGGMALWLVAKLPGSRWPVAGLMTMLVTVLLLTIWITPQIVLIGRGLDFTPRQPAPTGLRAFGLLHAAYTVLDCLKFALGAMVTLGIARVSPSSPDSKSKNCL